MAEQILSEQLVISPFCNDDITDDYLGWLNDKELMKYSRQRYQTHTKNSCEAYLASFNNSCNSFWDVRLRDSGLQIGTMTAFVDRISTVADIGILIGHHQMRGHGLGREAFGSLISYLFEYQNMRKVTAGTMELNEAMIRIADYWGMQLEGNLKEQEVFEGRGVTIKRYGILKLEWQKLTRRCPIEVSAINEKLPDPIAKKL
jgi:RimJ/RimL family protein N-acetyltransferase